MYGLDKGRSYALKAISQVADPTKTIYNKYKMKARIGQSRVTKLGHNICFILDQFHTEN